MTMYHDTQHPDIVYSHDMTTTTQDEMDPKDGSEEPPGRWHRSHSEMEMDVDVDSEDEVDRHLYINDDADSHQRIRSPNHYDTIDRPNRSDVDPSTTRTIGIPGTSESHARTGNRVQVQVEGRKKTWFDRLLFRRQTEPSAPVLPLSGAESALDPHRLPLPKIRSRSRPQSRASTPLTLPPLLPSHREEDERPESDGESDGEGEKMCRICFTGEDSDSESDSDAEDDGQDDAENHAEADAEDDDAEDQDHGHDRAQDGENPQTAPQNKDKNSQKKRENHQKKKKEKDAHPGSGSGPGLGSGLGRLISPCLCRGSMRVSSFRVPSYVRCQMSGVRCQVAGVRFVRLPGMSVGFETGRCWAVERGCGCGWGCECGCGCGCGWRGQRRNGVGDVRIEHDEPG